MEIEVPREKHNRFVKIKRFPSSYDSLAIITIKELMLILSFFVGRKLVLIEHTNTPASVTSLLAAFSHLVDGFDGELLIVLCGGEEMKWLLAQIFLSGNTTRVDLTILRSRKTMQLKEQFDVKLLGVMEEFVEVGFVGLWFDSLEVFESFLDRSSGVWGDTFW
jgi:hypothetical protein